MGDMSENEANALDVCCENPSSITAKSAKQPILRLCCPSS